MQRRRRGLAASVVAAVVLSGCASTVPPGQFVEYGGSQPQSAAATGGIAALVPGVNPSAAPTSGSAGSVAPGAGPNLGAGGNLAVGPGSGGGPQASNPVLPAGTTAGSCAGFTNSTGISNSAITLANASDVSGPVPGLFKSAQQAVQAFAAYFNATSSICGRTLKMEMLDSGTSSVGDQQAATSACSDALAMVGSMSAFDDGGATTVANCGIPDLRAISVNPARVASPVSYGTDSISVPKVPTEPYDYLKSVGGDAYQHAGIIYLNAGAAVINAKSFRAAAEADGYHFDYDQSIDVTTFNYSPFVADMQSKGIKLVQYTGAFQNAIRLKQAMDQQGFHPIFFMDSVAYDPVFVASGGGSVNGTYAFVDTALFEEASRTPEMQLYLQWLNRVAPGATPSFFGVFAWGAMRLFTQLALQLGGRLTRQNLLAAIRAVHAYTDDGLFAPQDVGNKSTSRCQTMIQLEGGVWVRRTPYPYACAGMIDTGVGGS